jgi:heme A synthase
MGIVVVVHSTLSNTVWLFFLALGLWGIYRAVRGQAVDGSYLGALAIGQALYIIQGILGGLLWLNGFLPNVGNPTMHILYGAFALVFLPFVYFVWLKGDDDSPQAQWVLALTTLFLFGVALRAIAVGA